MGVMEPKNGDYYVLTIYDPKEAYLPCRTRSLVSCSVQEVQELSLLTTGHADCQTCNLNLTLHPKT